MTRAMQQAAPSHGLCHLVTSSFLIFPLELYVSPHGGVKDNPGDAAKCPESNRALFHLKPVSRLST